MATNPPTRPEVPVSLALQGGGSLGAFTWGVLDRLLDEPWLRIAVVSGTSAGAMNAAMLVQGLATGGKAEARRLLETLWRRVAVASGSPDIAATDWFGPFGGLLEPMAGAFRRGTQALHSRSFGLAGLNPLRGVLHGLLDPLAFALPGAPALLVAATRVRTGEARLFRGTEVTEEVLLASACLPQLFPGVEIEGELYWDGGYASNPPVRPLIEAGGPADVIIIRCTPMERPGLPAGASGVQARSAEIAFGTALRQELRSIAVAQQLLREKTAPKDLVGVLARLRDARLHMIGAEEEFRALPPGSPLDTRWGFLQHLHDIGRDAAERWLAAHGAAIGRQATLDLRPFAPALATLSPG